LSIEELSNNEMKRTSHGEDEGSPLISVLGRQQMSGRTAAAIIVLGLAGAACDKMHTFRIVIVTPPSLLDAMAPQATLIKTTRSALAECSLQDKHISSDDDSVAWRDPNRLPGFHVLSHREGDEMLVTVAQELFGPVDATAAYRCVIDALHRRLERQFGKERVRVKS
jgi:hypothetical protein